MDSGQTETAYVLIRVPDGSVVTRVKFESNGDDTDAPTWVVPRQPAPPAPPAAQLGQPLSLGDERVTVLAVDDPVQGRPSTTSLPPGDHLVGVEVQITNTSSSAGDPPFEQLTVVDSAGRTNDVADLSASSGVPLNLVKAGQTVTTTVYFDVPQGARVVVVQTAWYPASLNGGAATVGWAVPPP